jgi:hypothetical protein
MAYPIGTTAGVAAGTWFLRTSTIGAAGVAAVGATIGYGGAIGSKIGSMIGPTTGAALGLVAGVTAVVLAVLGAERLVVGKRVEYTKTRFVLTTALALTAIYGSMGMFGAIKGIGATMGGAIGPVAGSLSGQIITGVLGAELLSIPFALPTLVFDFFEFNRSMTIAAAVGSILGMGAGTAAKIITTGGAVSAAAIVTLASAILGNVLGVMNMSPKKESSYY